MTTGTRIALIGDYDPDVLAHQAIPRALALALGIDNPGITWEWIHTTRLGSNMNERLLSFAALWCVPGSPYANTEGVLEAIRWARETQRPFLGTCGGFQHALLEYARSQWKMAMPAHAELDPTASYPVIVPLACALVEQTGRIFLSPGSRLAAIYGVEQAIEGYHCRYGLSPKHGEQLAQGPLRVSARDETGEVRAVELEGHPFFMATLFQPERAALSGRAHPLVNAFVSAAGRAVEALGRV